MKQKHQLIAALLVMVLMTAACGARLNDQQRAAVRASIRGNGSQTASDGTTDDTLATGDGSTSETTIASGDGSSTGGGDTTGTSGDTGSGDGSVGAATTNPHVMPAGGNGGATDVGVTANSIQLGNIATLTGPVPGLFAGARAGTQAVVAYENSLGGLFGRKIKLDARDDQFDAGQNKTLTADLVSKSLAMLGSFSLYDDAGADSIRSTSIPDVGHALGTTRLALPTNYSIQPSVPGGPVGPFNYFKAKMPQGIKAIGSIYSDIPSAVALHKGYKAAAVSVGYNYIYERAIGATETDFTSDVVRMRNSGVKIVYLTSIDDKSAARFAKAMKSQGWKPDAFVVNGSGYDADVLALAGDAAEGMYVTTANALYGGEDAGVVPEVALFDKWLANVKPGFKPDIFTAYAWASGRLLFKAMENIGPKVTRKAINEEIKKIGSFDDFGLFAPSNPAAKTPAPCFIITKVVNGKFVRVDSPVSGFRCDDGPWFYVK